MYVLCHSWERFELYVTVTMSENGQNTGWQSAGIVAQRRFGWLQQ